MDIEPFSLGLLDPLETATGTIDVRDGFLVRTGRHDSGGVGEATPLSGWTESLQECRGALEAVVEGATSLSDLDPTATPAARHGVELAFADAAAREQAVPLAGWLAPSFASSVPVNATIGDASVEETVSAARTAVDDGYETIKIKVGARSLTTDRRRVEAVADAVPSAALRLDANGAWSRAEARTAVDQFQAVGVSSIEQPLAARDLAGHAALRGNGIAIALDESIRAAGLDAILQAHAVDVVVIKPMAIGGIQRARNVALRARDHGIDPVVTTTVDGVVARTAALHLAASLEIDRACGLATADRLADDLAADPAPVRSGRMAVPTAPGVGVTPERH